VSDQSTLTEALAKALDEARQRRSRAEQELSCAQKLVDALEFTVQIQAGSSNGDANDLSDDQLPSAVHEWRALSRRSAVMRLLREWGKPISPKDLTTELHKRGRTDAYNGVAATLSRLKDDSKVESAGYGLWRLPGSAVRVITRVGPTPNTEERPDVDA